jgi:hypothetical protein
MLARRGDCRQTPTNGAPAVDHNLLPDSIHPQPIRNNQRDFMKKELLAVAVLATMASTGAHASLSLLGYGGFVEGSGSGFPGLTFEGCENGICTSIAWGTAVAGAGNLPPFNGRSAASINVLEDNTDPNSTPDDTKAEIVPNTPNAVTGTTVEYDHQPLNQWNVLGSLTHWNRRINQFNFLGEVEVDYTIEITDSVSNETISFNQIFDVDFFETLNTNSVEDCDPFPQNTGSDQPCDDWFDFEGTIDEKFVLGGTEYSIRIKGFCGDDEDPETCVPSRLYTEEQQPTVGLVYEIKQVPAPGALALISAGLLGLSWARRRQAKG